MSPIISKKSKAMIFTLTFFCLVSVVLVQAKSQNGENANSSNLNSSNPNSQFIPKKEEFLQKKEQKKQELVERSCQLIQNRIRTRINRYENNQSKDKKIFGQMVEKINKIENFFEGEGLNTDKLEGMILELEKMVNELNQIHANFINQLKIVEQNSCQNTTQFKGQLGEARKVLPQIKSQIQAIKEYYVTTIRPELINLKQQWQTTNLNTTNQESNNSD